jgi:branched-subunit amino acid aminotransferase/4-amino-4-deoxychorismate lyase
LILDPHATALEDTLDRDVWLYKTTQRAHYDAASVRGGPSHPEVLLHTPTHLLETATSNVALRLPLPPKGDAAGASEHEWVTPCLAETRPFLDGTVRQELLERGVIREGEVTVEDWERCRVESKGGVVVVVGFNGLRWVWNRTHRTAEG